MKSKGNKSLSKEKIQFLKESKSLSKEEIQFLEEYEKDRKKSNKEDITTLILGLGFILAGIIPGYEISILAGIIVILWIIGKRYYIYGNIW